MYCMQWAPLLYHRMNAKYFLFLSCVLMLSLGSCTEATTIPTDYRISKTQQEAIWNELKTFKNQSGSKDSIQRGVTRDPAVEWMYWMEDTLTHTGFFMVAQHAPSIHSKYTGLGGKYKRDSQGKITHYEEVFRTWKFPKQELEHKTKELFEELIQGKDWNYLLSDSVPHPTIEFPNKQCYYDNNQQKWIATDNPLSAFYAQ